MENLFPSSKLNLITIISSNTLTTAFLFNVIFNYHVKFSSGGFGAVLFFGIILDFL